MDQLGIFQKRFFAKGDRENYLLGDMNGVLGPVLDELSQRQKGKLPQKPFTIWMNWQCQMHGE